MFLLPDTKKAGGTNSLTKLHVHKFFSKYVYKQVQQWLWWHPVLLLLQEYWCIVHLNNYHWHNRR